MEETRVKMDVNNWRNKSQIGLTSTHLIVTNEIIVRFFSNQKNEIL